MAHCAVVDGLSRGALALLPFLALVACSGGEPQAPATAAGADHIACAVSGADNLADVCAVERDEVDGKLMLVVHHPDGAFRRFEVLTDGRGVAVADGADEAVTALRDGSLDVTVGTDRYVFPAKVRPKQDATGEPDVQRTDALQSDAN
ncbi:hypothetical protein [Novosphingobium sp. KN65.2]|uniref:hypothetical protein n=1 Tax=Novosphingobium sp. KN65.2 TaxID=1478134 RepID=UPI0005DDF20E|nr:hypothetical protein [Novosphingobium sp. KN65.2]CDO37720.1 conserved hypothetical protein [Novosphingobium sp. KN65.2]